MDLTGFPFPADAPEAGACIRIERPEPGLAVVVFDPPHRSFPVLDAPLLRDLDTTLAELEHDSALRGVVFAGRTTERFLAGADIEAIAGIEDPEIVENAILAVHGLFDRIVKLKARTVAAVGGPVPGGAYELSLACDRIVATDAKATKIGLPETQLGILPGWGGTHRLPRRVGIPVALDAILTGRLFPAKKAARLGMIDRITKPEYLVSVASDIAMGRKGCARRSRGWKGWLVDRNPILRYIIRNKALAGVDAKARGRYPAPYAALDMVMAAPNTPHALWASREGKAVAALGTGPVCKSLVSLFFGSEAAKRLGKDADGGEVDLPEHAFVVGGGVMGAGIASSLAMSGRHVRLGDLSRDALDGALREHRGQVDRRRKRRRMLPHEADAAIDRLDTTVGITGAGRATFAIEAVAEVLGVKQAVLSELAGQMSKTAILATNTSSLSVTEIAKGVPHQKRVVGMHFFNPVRSMPLVEVVRGAKTSDAVVTATCALAIRMGKTPVITKDVPGFLVNRLLGPYLDEAVRLFVGGADPARIDALLLAFGMPMGPFQLLDEVGFDIARHAATSLHEGYGDRMQPSDALEGLATPERLGRKTGKGFYDHPANPRKGENRALCHDLATFQTDDWARTLTDQDLVDRCVLAMVAEAARALEEEVVAGPAELDLATVFGTGFAPFRGGVWRYAQKRGLGHVRERLLQLQQAPDVQERGEGAERFAPKGALLDAD